MKAKKALGMALALASALFFVACSNLDSGSVDNGAASVYSSTRTLRANVNNVDLSDGSGTAVYDPWIQRTVLPGTTFGTGDLKLVLRAISNGKAEDYYFLTGGTAVYDTSTPPKLIGTEFVVPNLKAASYDLWLYAYVTTAIPAAHASDTAETLYKSSDAYLNTGAAVTTALWAHAAQDLTNGDNATPLEFNLSPIDLKGKGTVVIGGKCLDPDNSVTDVTVGVYNIYTNEAIKSTNVTPTSGPGANEKTFAATTWNDIPAGSYRAAVTFLNNGVEVGYWSDYIIVEPSNTSKKDDIDFKGIKTIPAAPTGLTAYLKEGTFGGGKETYDVVLEWADNATNEKGYLLRISTYTVDFTGGSETATQEVFGFASGTVRIQGTTTVSASALIDSGYFTQTATPATNLLLSQCTSITLTLKTGYLYDFEVVAYNAIGCSKYSDDNATTDMYADVAESGSDGIWTPRAKLDTPVTTFTSGKMAYMKKDADAAVTATWDAVDTTAEVVATPGTDYYDASKDIAYVTKMPAGSEYYTLASGGTPYTPYHVNLYYVRYDLEGGVYYDGAKVSNGSQYAFFRFGNDAPTFNTNFGTAGALKRTDPLKNPITAADGTPTPTSAGTAASKAPFILQWNSSNTAYSNWVKWLRQSASANGHVYSYKPAAGSSPIPADPLLLTADDAAFGNQVVYAEYAGANSDLTVLVKINSAAQGLYIIQDAAIEVTAASTDASFTPATIDTAEDAAPDAANNINIINVDKQPNLVLQLKTTPIAYTHLRYEINGVVQSATVDSSTGVCTVPMKDWSDAGTIRVLMAGYYQGAWYSRAFSFALTGSN
ncbi:MAG: hypothetical protein J6V90_10185 [Treponema sp.]|nr:hypothetical protein [Treponema sp.]